MLPLIEQYADAILPVLCEVDPQPSGMLPSEMLAFVALCKSQGVTAVIESGRKFGYSTEVIARCLPECRIASFESAPKRQSDQRLERYTNLRLIDGDPLLLPISPFITGRTALLLDGPKGAKAYHLVSVYRDRLALGAIHDLCGKNELRPSLPDDTWFTDDATMTERYAHLDSFWVTNGGYQSRTEMTRESYCLGVFRGGLWQ